MTTPPPKPLKPGQVKVVRALYTYDAQCNDELSFEEGDLLYIFDMISSPDWWKARANGKEGLIPSNYVSKQTETIDNPIHESAKRGNLEFLYECLANKVSVNGLDNAGCTPLHWAASGGHYDCAVKLIESKCQIDIRNKLGETPLHNAALKGHAPIVELLLKNGANPTILNNDKETPFKLARNAECAALLRIIDPRVKSNIEHYVDPEDSD